MLTTTSGQAAFDILADNEVDLVLCDLVLPDMSGVEFFSRIRIANPEAMRVLLTDCRDPDEVIRSINEAAVYQIMSWAWQSDQLRLLIRRALESRELARLHRYGVHWDGTRLWVADSGNRRVLMWHGIPATNGRPADLVLGQRDFGLRDENGGGVPTLSSVRWPHGVALWGGRLCVTDAGNNRIMVWDTVPGRDNQACDWLLGQNDPAQVDHNQSLYWPSDATLHMPYGIAAAGDWLLAADTANSRLLAWHADDAGRRLNARALTGQADFHAKGDNRWALPSRDSLCWPYGIAVCAGLAAVADSGNNRVLLWRVAPELGS